MAIPDMPIYSTKFINPDIHHIFQNPGALSYLTNMNSTNMSARHTTYQTRILDYSSAILHVSESEKQAVERLIQLMLARLHKQPRCANFIKHQLRHVFLAKCKTWLEGGMPHTHENIILLPESWYGEIDNASTRTNQQQLSDNGATLTHEICHVYQRKYPDKFTDLYKRWNMTHASYIDNFEAISALNRENPDGSDIYWIWEIPQMQTFYWLGAVFKSHDATDLRDVRYIAQPVYKLSTTEYKVGESPAIALNTLDIHKKYFGISTNHYHPSEISAEYFALWYRRYLGYSVNGDVFGTPGYKTFEKWLDAMVA
jgi:hypothetical protein